MKIVELACPNCTAALKIDSDKKSAKCEYCGYEFIIDDEVKRVYHSHSIANPAKTGYEFEMGRILAHEHVKRKKELELRKAYNRRREAEVSAVQANQIVSDMAQKEVLHSKWLTYTAVGVGISFLIPYLFPLVATGLILVSPIKKLWYKVGIIVTLWVIALAIIGIRLQ